MTINIGNQTGVRDVLANPKRRQMLVEALRRAGPNPTRARVVKALESMNSFDTGGVIVNYSPANRIGSRYVEVTVIGSSGKLLK